MQDNKEHDNLREAMAAADATPELDRPSRQEVAAYEAEFAAATEPFPDTRKMILELQQSKYPDDDIGALLRERGKTHGEYTDHALVTQQLKTIVRTHCNLNSGVRAYDLLSPIMQETLDMIMHKVGRILAGDPNHPDHWDDLAGYPKLVSQRLKK